MTNTVLIYAPNGSKKIQRLKVAIVRLGVRFKLVTSEMMNQTIGELLGLTNEEIEEYASDAKAVDTDIVKHVSLDENASRDEINEEIVVMWNFSNVQIDTLLGNFRKAGAGKVNLKAIVTPHNIKWTFEELAAELQKEHVAYQNN